MLILPQSDKRTKLDKEVELAEDDFITRLIGVLKTRKETKLQK